ncbi:VOC family protein [Streptomyces nigrescens]
MAGRPQISLATVVLDCPDAHALADFYRRLLGWEVKCSEPDWVLLRCPDGGTGRALVPVRARISGPRVAGTARGAAEDAPSRPPGR